MTRDTPQQRASSARSDIRYLTQEIDDHDRQASRLRKERSAARAKLERAEKAIARENASRAWSKT